MGSVYDKGLFQWHDLRTTDVEKAKSFYTQLFGWSIIPAPMGEFTYDMIAIDGVPFGGIVPGDAGLSTQWLSYIGTADADASAKKVAELGGKILVEPMDIPDVGRFATATDPAGAEFSTMHWANPTPGVDPFALPAIGGVSWNELLTDNVEGEATFYANLNGYTITRAPMDGGPDYVMLAIDNNGTQTNIAGIAPRPEGMQRSAWVVYFRTGDIRDVIKRIDALHGEVVGPVIEIPGTGKVTTAIDPTGAYFKLHEPE